MALICVLLSVLANSLDPVVSAVPVVAPTPLMADADIDREAEVDEDVPVLPMVACVVFVVMGASSANISSNERTSLETVLIGAVSNLRRMVF